MIGCSTESTWTPKIQIKDVNTKNQRHEFLDVFLQPFLSIRKQSTMSKRAQERKIEEKLAVAKPRSTCLVSRKLTERKANFFV